MSNLASLLVHESQFPAQIQRDLIESLRTHRINHKFHYDSVKQTQKWLAVHDAYSPARTDPDCAGIYDQAFAAAVRQTRDDHVNVIGLGAGGGQKDARLLELLSAAGKDVAYRPVEAGTAMALTAREESLKIIVPEKCFPVVCDLANARLSEIADIPIHSDRARIFTFFGMLPNFEPETILSEFTNVLRSGDTLLVSANLAPGSDYDVGVQKIMPLYDNPETRDWLMTFLLDLGIERDDGNLEFSIQEGAAGLKRIEANFKFTNGRKIRVGSESFHFSPGENVRLFFSYRHTPQLLQSILNDHGLTVAEQWITRSSEEGVFQVRPLTPNARS